MTISGVSGSSRRYTVTVPGSDDEEILTIGMDEFVLWLDCGHLGGDYDVSPTGLFVAAHSMSSSKCGTAQVPPWLSDADHLMKVGDGLELRKGETTLAVLQRGAEQPVATDILVSAYEGDPNNPAVVKHFRSLGAPQLPDGWSAPTLEALYGTWIPVLATRPTAPVTLTIDDQRMMRIKDGCNGGGGRIAYADGEVVLGSYPSTLIGCTAPIGGWVQPLRGFGIKDGHLGFFAEDGSLIGELARQA